MIFLASMLFCVLVLRVYNLQEQCGKKTAMKSETRISCKEFIAGDWKRSDIHTYMYYSIY